MGFMRELFTGNSPVVLAALEQSSEAPSPRFAVDAEAIPAQIFGLESYADPIAPAPRISRREAIQCAPLKSARDLVVNAVGNIPLTVIDTDRVTRVNDLLEQPERGVARSVTMTWTAEDLLFEGVAYWRVTERSWDGYPAYVKRIDTSRVSIDADTGTVRINGSVVPSRDLIVFHSPNDPLLVAGARAIRSCLRLDAAAANAVDGTPPVDYFTPAEGADPADDAVIGQLLRDWADARRKGSTAYIPAALKYTVNGFSPEQLQMSDARQHAALEIARVARVDAEELGVSTTSRTYANMFERRKAFIDFTLAPFLNAITERLSMGDVTKRGYRVVADFDTFLRSDTKTRFETYKLGLEVGALEQAEIRAAENKPVLATPAPAATPTEVTQ